MEKHRAIPQGYMTAGVLAKKMNTTVRTLQYYDKEGLLAPSAESEGGRRLYTDKDLVKLHQILSLKYFGFTLDDIKNRFISLDTPEDVANALTHQAKNIQEQIARLSEALRAIEALKDETLQMQTVDFNKYADIIVNLQMKNEFYWLIKYFDDKVIDHLHSRFDRDSGLAMIETINCLWNEAIQFQKDNVPPDSQKGQDLAKRFWDMVTEFTGGDMSLLPDLIKFSEITCGLNNDWKKLQADANGFIEPALGAYFAASGYNPLVEGSM